jgi:hypothetical protein
VLGQGYKYEPLEFVIGIEQFHNKPALCQLLGAGIRVTRKIRVGFFEVSRNRVSENATGCLTDEMETRHFGYPKIRVRIQVIPELTEQSALFKNSQKISKVIHPLTESTQHKLTTQYNFTSIEERRGQKGMQIGEEKHIVQLFTDLAC